MNHYDTERDSSMRTQAICYTSQLFPLLSRDGEPRFTPFCHASSSG